LGDDEKERHDAEEKEGSIMSTTQVRLHTRNRAGNLCTLSLRFFGEDYPRRGKEFFKRLDEPTLLSHAAELLNCTVEQLVQRGGNPHQVKVSHSFDDSYFVEVDEVLTAKVHECPECGLYTVVEGPSGFACDPDREGCSMTFTAEEFYQSGGRA
jgi:hypothetical protein